MAEVIFDKVEKIYDNDVVAVHDLSLEIGDGEFVVLVGPSGCGKTTALRMVAGLEDITDGRVSIGGRVVNDLTPKERDIAMVFQNYALYPHLSVADNIGFGLRLRRTPKDIVEERVAWAAQLLGLTPYLHRRPKELSGGQRQRVAMGRAIVREPEAYLMDEPLSNLDAKLRVHMRAEIAGLQDTLGVTTIYVTHDQVEAMTLGQRVAVLRRGELQQVAPPQELYERPVNLFVAGFIGSPAMNLVEATIERADGKVNAKIGSQELTLDDAVVKARPRLEEYDGRQVVMGIRPESLEDASLAPEIPADRHVKGVLVLREPLGSEIIAHFEVDAPPALTEDVRELARDVGSEGSVQAPSEGDTKTTLVGRFGPRSRVKSGDVIDVAVDTSAVHLFDLENGSGIYD